MSNFHHPRALIDINQKSDDQQQLSHNTLLDSLNLYEDEDKQKEKKNISTILLEIEKVKHLF